MLAVNVLAIAAGLLMGLAKMGQAHIMVIAGRAVMGFYCGKKLCKVHLRIFATLGCPKGYT